MVPMFAASLPPSAIVQIDARVALVTLIVALSIGTLLGVVAGFRSCSFASVADTLRAGRRSGVAPRVARMRSALVVAQVAFAVVLLGVAGLLVRSVVRLSRVSPGFSSGHVLTLRLSLDGSGYTTASKRIAFVDELVRRLAAAPAIDRAAIVSRLPLGGARGADAVEIEGRPLVPGKPIIIDQRHITPDYFQAMGIRVLRGRVLASTDDSRAELVTLINRTMADRYFPNADPIDKRVRTTGGFGSGQWLRIVGIVDDVRHVALSRPPVPEMYRPFAQLPVGDFAVVVKTRVEPMSTASIVRSVVRSLDPNLPIYDMRTMEDRVAASFAQLRATMVLLMATAALAAVLASIAIYGSIWYSVAQRIPEIGLRMALGASPASLAVRIVSRAFALTAIGAAIGVAVAVPAASTLGELLFDTRRSDPVTYAVAILAVALLTAIASIVPARHAIRVDPSTALRAN
jgi:predicted permease